VTSPWHVLVYGKPIESEGLMSAPGAGSGTASRVEQRGKRVTGMRQTPATAAIAADVLTVIAITPSAFARGDTAGGGHVSGSNAGPSCQPSYSATRAANENISGVHQASSAGSARQLSSSGRREGWHSGSTPPSWTGHGEKRGWDGGKMPPRLSHRDRDPQWHDPKFDPRAQKGDRERPQFDTSQLERP
jgi:hypothetical protein